MVNRAREIRLRGEGARTPGNKTGGSGEKVDESGKQAFRRTKESKRVWRNGRGQRILPYQGNTGNTVDVHNLTHF
ncbi:MAG: hypothetical protein VX911_00385 [Candidatus Latescibacterota bacterium]|nr:hypothetical protein [Candidatus Latescibacterota bacterium]